MERSYVSKTLYVGNLNEYTTENEVRALFGQVGRVVSVAMLVDWIRGKQTYLGMVKMESEEAAQEAVRRFHNTVMNQRQITVRDVLPSLKQRIQEEYQHGARLQ
jgi:RNA recognition motif-containing protein